MHNLKFNKTIILVWILSFLALLVNELIKYGFAINIEYSLIQISLEAFYPTLFCTLLLFINYLPNNLQSLSSYILFFTISVCSALGLTKTLTGSHSVSSNYLLTGLSFYTASIAYLISQRNFNKYAVLSVSNPLLLITGPIALYFKDQSYKKFKNRFQYYSPFIILGVFLHQTIATPLTKTFTLLPETDVASSLIFALLFELFVYANFCGLSLLIYGVLGIMGIKIPLNFRQPFSATNIVDFWKGWHTSLSLVLKTLFYSPLRKKWGSSIAIFGVYISSALWHGVTFNFLIWGTFHALVFLISVAILKRKIPVLPFILMIFGSVVGRLIFADSDTSRLIEKFHFKFTDFSVFDKLMAVQDEVKISIVLIMLFVASECIFQKTKYFRNRNYKFFRLPIVQLIILFITVALLSKEMGTNYAVYGQR
jgi:D-alanyl-lipoteichoic acid acyltransferase DltB (MBOAT superfamily)